MPAPQPAQLDEPNIEYVPALQSKHAAEAAAPVEAPYVPAAQPVQLVERGALPYVPTLQLEQLGAPLAE